MDSVVKPSGRNIDKGAAVLTASGSAGPVAGLVLGDSLRGALIAIFLTVLGLVGFSSQLQGLWHLWMGDPLRQIGILIPPVSVWLALRNWSRRDWSSGGSWWGFVLLTTALALAVLFSILPTGMSFASAPTLVSVNLVPRGLLLCAYFSGVVLFFGGVPAWRKAAFPLALWLCVNPVPGGFTELFDLPAQALAARVARGFAHLLSVPVEGDSLKLMFSSDLGIFIAAGCDGLRGATTMGYLALIVGYLYKLPAVRLGAFVLAAVLLAYAFNFLRLCGVICYYWIALRVPALGDYGTEIDYLIGGILFFFAAWFLRSVPRSRFGGRACSPNSVP